MTDKAEARLHLARGRDRNVRGQHPWIFSGSVQKVDGQPNLGDTVVVVAHDGSVLGRAAYSPTSQIRARLWTYDEATAVNDAFIVGRVEQAVALRLRFVLRPGDDGTDCARLIFGEGDGLPGLIADLYGHGTPHSTVVLQCQSAGAERVRDVVTKTLVRLLAPACVFERSDADVRTKEGLEKRTGPLHGQAPGRVVVKEHGMRFTVEPERGHKTGFYLDQRDARAAVRRHTGLLPGPKRVLNCFSYTGGFSLAALCGGADHVTSVDTSMAALELGQENARDNRFADDKHDWVKGDCFQVLRGMEQDQERYDLIVLDPPKFAPSKAQLEGALRGYHELNLRALKLLNDGGMLFTFSCSGAVDRDVFQETVGHAAVDAGVFARGVVELGHPPDHPVAPTFPEGAYLKGLGLVVHRR